MDFRREGFYITQHEALNSFSSSSTQFSEIPSSFLVPQSQSSWSTASLNPPIQPFSWQNTATSTIKKVLMFDKVVTPSDVGKLNRLVIPKQHAEKHFPFDTAANEKGLILCFEDRTGKSWRFRYSYWNSSQSYVMTKGWSRFVKEKQLNAGDTVSFCRGIGDASTRSRLFIDWHRSPLRLPRVPMPTSAWSARERPFVPPLVSTAISCTNFQHNYISYEHNVSNLSSSMSCNKGEQLIYFRSPATIPPSMQEDLVILDSVPVMQRKVSAKRVRLFGVNLDYHESERFFAETDDSSSKLHGPAMSKTMELMPSGGDTSEELSWTTTMSTTNKGSLSFDLDL